MVFFVTMLLIAVHGADLTNMVFLPKGAAVIEIGAAWIATPPHPTPLHPTPPQRLCVKEI